MPGPPAAADALPVSHTEFGCDSTRGLPTFKFDTSSIGAARAAAFVWLIASRAFARDSFKLVSSREVCQPDTVPAL